ncbi:MAG TPA: Ig-like domain-containing protein, partial [Gemmatimonadales bacterium]|nr:Ig-like domain-containing protein [Gemmatimonadales bacterium]
MLLLHRYRRLFTAFTVSVVAVYCGGGDNIGPPAAGTLEITTSTSGVELDADGYTVQIDGGSVQTVGVEATITTRQVTPGAHTVLLGGLAANCSVAGDIPRSVTVTAGETTTVSFEVTCTATTGSLTITSATSGPSPDADGYTISIDGVERGTLSANAAVTISGLTPGTHPVALGGVAGNCQIQGDNARTVTITAGEDASVVYTITCAPPPAGAGDLRIITATSGPDPDQDGYTFTVDGGSSQPIAINAQSLLSNFAPGSHSVELAGLSGNCTLQGANPRSVTVTGGATVDLRFAITCTATTGTIRVSVTTSGSPADPDGYTVTLNEQAPGLPVATNGTVSFSSVAAGIHTIALSGLAANCSVPEGSSQAVTLEAGASSEVSFSVTCTPAGVASQLVKISGDLQTGRVGAVLGAPLVVKVTDALGGAVQGVAITWSTTGGGSLSATSTQTDANGEASVTRTLGGTIGQQTTLATADDLAGSPATFTHTATGDATGGVGRWDPAFTTPVVGVHMHLLPTGKVLLWGDRGDAQIWDPTSGGFTPVAKTYRIYCTGHTMLADGRLLVVGGTSPNTRGLRFATIFDPSTNSWSATSSMAQGRYYPTITALPNGHALAVSGHDTALSVVTIPEVWDGSTWRRLTTAPLAIPNPFYPAMFVAPNGQVFLAGFNQPTRYLDVTGTGRWTTVANRNVEDRVLGSAVMYAPGKILYVGGGQKQPFNGPPTATA